MSLRRIEINPIIPPDDSARTAAEIAAGTNHSSSYPTAPPPPSNSSVRAYQRQLLRECARPAKVSLQHLHDYGIASPYARKWIIESWKDGRGGDLAVLVTEGEHTAALARIAELESVVLDISRRLAAQERRSVRGAA